MFLVNSRLDLFTAARVSHLAPLLPKLRGQFAEFLNQSSLERLRILSSPTCVSFSTVPTHVISRRAFLGTMTSAAYMTQGLWHRRKNYLNLSAELPAPIHGPTYDSIYLVLCVPRGHLNGRAGILTCCPSTTPFGLALGTASPSADLPSGGNLRFTATRILTLFIVTHPSIFTCMHSNAPLGTPSTQHTTLVYHAKNSAEFSTSKASVSYLAPYIFGTIMHRPVSCYALFKWWLLLSQHPGCLRTMTSLTT